MYLLIITAGLCLTYFVLYFLFSIFFKNSTTVLNSKAMVSVLYIVLGSFLSYVVSTNISNLQLANRVLHALGGGAVGMLICFLVVRDSKLKINRFQFFVFSFLIVMTLGIANETIEYFLQTYAHYIFAPTPTDTWLDLISNLTGALAAGVILTPFVNKK